MSRLSHIIKAKVSRILDSAEDPRETLDYAYQRQLEELQKVKRGIADVVTAKKRLQLQRDKLADKHGRRDEQARAAILQANDDLARTALLRKESEGAEVAGLDAQIAELADQQERLIAAEQTLRSKVEAFRTKKEIIKAQYNAAAAQVRVSEAFTGVGGSMADTGLALQRAMDQTEQMRARADATAELEAAGVFESPLGLGDGDDIDRQLAQLSSGSAVDDQLAALKGELGVATAPAIESGHPFA